MGQEEKKDNKDKGKEQKETSIKVPMNKDNEYHFAFYTNEKLKIKFKGNLPLIDAHMHIQSNNIAPMNIQYGILLRQLVLALQNHPYIKPIINVVLGCEKSIEIVIDIIFVLCLLNPTMAPNIIAMRSNYDKSSIHAWIKGIKKLLDSTKVYDIDKMTVDIVSKLERDILNTVMAILNDFGKLGTLDTDNVARVFMGEVNGLEAKEYAVGLETFEKLKSVYGLNLEMKTVAGMITELKKNDGMSTQKAVDMIKLRNKLYENFNYMTKYYYDDIKIFHMNVVLPMDLGYSHYWGYFGIPIYFPKDSDNVYYIKSFTYYLSVFDHVVFAKSFMNKRGNLDEKDGKDFIKKIEKRTNDRLIKVVVNHSEDAYKKIESYSKHIKDNTEIGSFPDDINTKVKNIRTELEKVIVMLKNMEAGYKSDSKEKGMTVRYKEEISDFAVKIINEYNESLKQGKDDEDLMKSYHFVSNYIGYRLEKLEETTGIQLDRLKGNSFFDAIEELREVTYEMKLEIGKLLLEGLKADVGYMKPKANKAVEKINKEAEKYKKTIKDIEKKINDEIDLVKKHYTLTKNGLNKILPHNLKISDNKKYFTIKTKRTTDWSDNGISETFKEQDETKDMNNSAEYDKYLNKDNNMYLDQAPGKERKSYESYKLHLTRVLASALRFAFRMLPFYHYDPRRHYGSAADLKNIKDDLKKNFAFHIFGAGNMEMPNITPIEFTDKYFDSLFKQEKTSNEDAFALVQTGSNDGICWGYKMYTELGYVPYMFDQNDRGYPLTKETLNGRYEHLRKFYEHCQTNKIPITCHGSPQGMTIADTHLYKMIKDNKLNQGEKFEKMLYSNNIKFSAQSFKDLDDMCVHPKNWDKVLQKFSSLKLCLAHYGGYTLWTENSENSKKYKEHIKESLLVDWRKDMTDLINKYENVYTDISCFINFEEAIPKFIEGGQFVNGLAMANNGKNALTKKDYDLLNKCYTGDNMGLYYTSESILNSAEKARMKSILVRCGIIKDDIDTVATNLAKEINGNTKLKKRIMMGTDWPMFEMSFAGVGEYYSRMFELLMLVTKKLDDKFDAWYQFTVINPLRFLNILSEDEKKVDKVRLTKMKDSLVKFINKIEIIDLLRDYRITDKEKGIIIKKTIPEYFAKLERICEIDLPKSTDIKDPEDKSKLLILKE
jgi:predicted TIM-barrel fold metal-dependent hydrolase